MTRRIIFINNPYAGSKFRTIKGKGENINPLPIGKYIEAESIFRGSSGKIYEPEENLEKPKTAKDTPRQDGLFEGTGGALYQSTPNNWFMQFDKPNLDSQTSFEYGYAIFTKPNKRK